MAEKQIPEPVYDLVIVGGGPAGFTAGLYGARAGLKTLLMEGASTVSQITVTDLIENYPGIPEGINGFDLIDLSLIDAREGSGGSNDAFAFKATKGAAFTGAGQIRWYQENPAGTGNDKTIIQGNTDADLAAEFQIELKGLVTLKATDFIL